MRRTLLVATSFAALASCTVFRLNTDVGRLGQQQVKNYNFINVQLHYESGLWNHKLYNSAMGPYRRVGDELYSR